MAGNGAGDDGGGSVGERVGQRQMRLIGVVIVAAATARIGVEKRRIILKGVRVVIGAGMMVRRTSSRRLGRHDGGVAGRLRWRIRGEEGVWRGTGTGRRSSAVRQVDFPLHSADLRRQLRSNDEDLTPVSCNHNTRPISAQDRPCSLEKKNWFRITLSFVFDNYYLII